MNPFVSIIDNRPQCHVISMIGGIDFYHESDTPN